MLNGRERWRCWWSLQQYLKKIEETVAFLKKEGVGGTARLALDALSARVEDAKKFTSNVLPYIENGAEAVLAQVTQAWTHLSNNPQGRSRLIFSLDSSFADLLVSSVPSEVLLDVGLGCDASWSEGIFWIPLRLVHLSLLFNSIITSFGHGVWLAVIKVLQNLQPTVELAHKKYLEAHNAIAVSFAFVLEIVLGCICIQFLGLQNSALQISIHLFYVWHLNSQISDWLPRCAELAAVPPGIPGRSICIEQVAGHGSLSASRHQAVPNNCSVCRSCI